MSYSRTAPSPRYAELQGYYKSLHNDGDSLRGYRPEEMFDGRSLKPHTATIKHLLMSYRAASLIDYGCGKAMGYDNVELNLPDGRKVNGLREFFAPAQITLYDPGYAPFNKYPEKPADGLVSTDVLEHIPEADIGWVLDEMFRLGQRFVFCTIACYPARKLLPDGSNAHVTLQPPSWWIERLEAASAHFDHRDYVAVFYLPDQRQLTISNRPTPPQS